MAGSAINRLVLLPVRGIVEISVLMATIARLTGMDTRFEPRFGHADIPPVRTRHRGVGVALEAIGVIGPVRLLDGICESCRDT